jgi:hypothetical protein
MSEREKYHAVNGQWPDEVPPLTGPEAIAAAKRLYRFTMKKPWKGKWALTSGRRYTWPRGSTFYVNPNRGSGLEGGWRDLVHMLSHYCHRQLWPRHKPHGPNHHFIEKEMVEYILKSGWLDGRLKPKSKAKPDAKSVAATRLAQLDASAKRWTTKLRRANTALRKIARQRAALARRERTQEGPC